MSLQWLQKATWRRRTRGFKPARRTAGEYDHVHFLHPVLGICELIELDLSISFVLCTQKVHQGMRIALPMNAVICGIGSCYICVPLSRFDKITRDLEKCEVPEFQEKQQKVTTFKWIWCLRTNVVAIGSPVALSVRGERGPASSEIGVRRQSGPLAGQTDRGTSA